MSTPKHLKAIQTDIHKRIFEIAKLNNLSTDDIEPVPDGIYDIEKYLCSSPKIMWILKEPYDDTDKNGNPCGGGWFLNDAFDNDDAWKNPTWQPIIYIQHGIKYKCHWNDMDWIRNDKLMVDRLKEIAYINVSKMPALTQSDDNQVQGNFESYWKDIIIMQIQEYQPEVIICGNTYWMIKDIFNSIFVSEHKIVEENIHILNIIKTSKFTILDVYHPNQKVKNLTRELYVNTIIDKALESQN